MKFMTVVKKPNINKVIFLSILFFPFLALSQKSALEFEKYQKLDVILYPANNHISLLKKNNCNNLIPYSFNHLGAFCKIENSLSKNTHFPIRLRLGTVQYVDQLEYKIPAYKLIQLENR